MAEAMAKLMNLEEASGILGICSRQMRKIIKEGKIPFVNVGNKTRPAYRFRPADIDAFISGRITLCQPKSQVSSSVETSGISTSGFKVIDFTELHMKMSGGKPKGGLRKSKPKNLSI